jgi:hypothetical protein
VKPLVTYIQAKIKENSYNKIIQMTANTSEKTGKNNKIK